MIKAVLFDFGGVLSESGKKGFIRNILATLYDIPIDSFDKLQADWRRNATDDYQIIELLNKRYNKQITTKMFYDLAHGAITRSEEVYDLAKRLRSHGIATGILSNIFTTTARELRDKGFYDSFDPIILSCDEGFAKPDEQLYRIAIQKTGVGADEILFIDDQEKCRPPAEALGMHFLLAQSPAQIVHDTERLILEQNGLHLG